VLLYFRAKQRAESHGKEERKRENMAKIHYFREGKLVVEEEKEEEYSEYKLDIIYSKHSKRFMQQ